MGLQLRNADRIIAFLLLLSEVQTACERVSKSEVLPVEEVLETGFRSEIVQSDEDGANIPPNNSSGSTNAIAEASTTPMLAPGAFIISSIRPRNGEIVVSWTGSTAATAYRLQRGSASGAWTTILSENANSPHLDSGLTNGTQYFYMVTAVNAVASVDANVEATGTPFATATPTLALSSPTSSPNNTPKPTFRITGGTFAFGDTLSLHNTSNCTGGAIATSGILADTITELDLGPSSNITANTDLSFSAKNVSVGGITTCSVQNIVYHYDNTGPSVTIARASGQAYQIASGGSAADFTATFDRNILGFEVADITPEVGALNLSFSIFSTADLKVFTLRAISPSGMGRIQPKIAAGTLTDTFGNYNVLAVNTSAVVYSGGLWRTTSRPVLPITRTQHTTTLLNDGRVFLAGGATNGGGALGTATIYDPSTNSFQNATNQMPIERIQMTSTLLSDGRVLVAHGSKNNVLTNTVTIYDPVSNSFNAGTTLSIGRINHTASLLANGKVLIAGGTFNVFSNSINSADIFDPTNATYTNIAINGSRHGHSAIVLSNGKVLLVGGSSGTTVLDTGVIYDPGPSTVTAVANTMAGARQGFTATRLTNGKVLVAGGSNGTMTLNSADIYDPATNSFSPINDIGGARQSHTATLLNDGRVILVGGTNGSNLDSATIYDPTSNSFTYISSIMGERSAHSSVLLPDGRVLAVAGRGASNSILNSAVFFDPLTNTFISTPNNFSSIRIQTSATIMSGGKVGIFGGYNGSAWLDSSEIFE